MAHLRMAADLTQKPTAADLTGTGTLIGNRRNMRYTGQKTRSKTASPLSIAQNCPLSILLFREDAVALVILLFRSFGFLGCLVVGSLQAFCRLSF
jgi:hypothetical protein